MSEQGLYSLLQLSFYSVPLFAEFNLQICFYSYNFFQFGLSLLYALLSQGEKLLSSGAPLEPSIGDFEMW